MPPGSRMDGSDSANELGRPVVTNLSGGGYSVVAADRDEGKLEGLLDEVHREVADPTDPSVAAPLIDRIVRDEGPPHILVDTLGAFIPGEALATAPNQLRTMLDVNLGAALWLTQAVVPHMVQRVSGAILHVSARPALDPTPGMAAYSASKAPLTQFTRTLDLVLRPLGIRVKSTAPQFIDTKRNREGLPEELLTRAVAPEALADNIAFLVSDAAAPISGAILPTYG